METTKLPPIPSTLPAAIASKFNLTLTSAHFQAFADEEAKLVYNEDNLPKIREFLDKGKKIVKEVEKTHTELKAESLQYGRNCDIGKRIFTETVEAIIANPQKKYTEICQAVTKRQQEESREKTRKENIQNGIETNAVTFANQIANAQTTAELIYIERMINLEKGKKEKYMEFLEQAAEKFTELNSQLAKQKIAIKVLEDLEKQKQDAIEKGNDEKALEIITQQEEVTSRIEETKVNVQEAAVTPSRSFDTYAPVVNTTPTIKPKRSVWKWEVKDMDLLKKKAPQWTVTTANKDAIDQYLEGKKLEGIAKDTEEFETAGVRFYLDKQY